jgi:acylglycerol lipase
MMTVERASRIDQDSQTAVKQTTAVWTAPSADGTPILLRSWSAGGRARASVLIIHGLGEHSGRYDRTARVMSDAGLAVQALDLRGFGGSGGPRGRVRDLGLWLDDMAERIRSLRFIDAARPVVVLGHSLGGLLSILYAESDRPAPDLMVLDAPAIADTPRRHRLGVLFLSAIAPARALPGEFDGSLLSRDPEVGVSYIADPLNHRPLTASLACQLISAKRRAIRDIREVSVPTLVVHGDADRIVPVDATEVLAGLAHVERRVYPGLRHEMLNEPEGPDVASDIAHWILDRVP